MSCPSKLELEAAVLGELDEPQVLVLDAHAQQCPRCRHELNWQKSEAQLFAQRAARDEVSRLWANVEQQSKERKGLQLGRVLMAAAASVLIAVVGGSRLLESSRYGARGAFDSGPMSLELMSVDENGDGTLATMPCYTPGFGIACGQVGFASR